MLCFLLCSSFAKLALEELEVDKEERGLDNGRAKEVQEDPEIFLSGGNPVAARKLLQRRWCSKAAARSCSSRGSCSRSSGGQLPFLFSLLLHSVSEQSRRPTERRPNRSWRETDGRGGENKLPLPSVPPLQPPFFLGVDCCLLLLRLSDVWVSGDEAALVSTQQWRMPTREEEVSRSHKNCSASSPLPFDFFYLASPILLLPREKSLVVRPVRACLMRAHQNR